MGKTFRKGSRHNKFNRRNREEFRKFVERGFKGNKLASKEEEQQLNEQPTGEYDDNI